MTSKMNDELIIEWVNRYGQFLIDVSAHQVKRYEEDAFIIMWCGVVASKYINARLLGILLETVSKLSGGNVNSTSRMHLSICQLMRMNPASTMEIALAYPNLPWTFHNMIFDMNDMFDHSSEQSQSAWDWKFVSTHDSVTMDTVLANIDAPWSWYWLSRHRNIAMSDI